MMTRIEEETFSDGFRVGLVHVRLADGVGGCGFRAMLFDGGRAVDALERARAGRLSAVDYLDLRRFLARLAAPPHVLAGYGTGWRELLAQVLAEHWARFRVLDLERAAARLDGGLADSADLDTLCGAYGLPSRDEGGELRTGSAEELLWAVVGRAGRQGLGWAELVRLGTAEPFRVGFERYGFDEETLGLAPAGPGVYVMRDRGGQVLYVGKAASLQRRLRDYFRAVPGVPAKIRALRDRIYDLDLHPVGSELEAILLEQRCIEKLGPAVNTQRTVAEGGSRYGPPPGPVLMLLPSVRSGSVEVFGFRPGRAGVQIRLRPDRPARHTVSAALQVLHGQRRGYPRRANLTDWGTEGAELMMRFFGRRRDRIAWLEPSPDNAGVERVVSAARAVLAEPPEAVEFRP